METDPSPHETLTEEQVVQMLREQCRGNAALWAREHGLTKVYVSRVLAGMAPPGPAIVAGLGLRRIVYYEKAA